MKLLDWFNKKFRTPKENYCAKDFYLMLCYYDISTNNIAVIGDDKKYKLVVNGLMHKLKKEGNKNYRVIKLNDDHYLFLCNELETNYMHIRDIHYDLEYYQIKYRKFI